jgi:hypothetical protein
LLFVLNPNPGKAAQLKVLQLNLPHGNPDPSHRKTENEIAYAR